MQFQNLSNTLPVLKENLVELSVLYYIRSNIRLFNNALAFNSIYYSKYNLENSCLMAILIFERYNFNS